MGSLHFIARRYLGWLMVGAFIFASYAGCERLDESAGSGAMEDVKLTVLDPRGQPSGIFGSRGEPGSHIMAIFDPETQPTVTRDELASLRMAPRLDNLENKTIYLVNTGFAGSKEFFEEMQGWFSENMPSVKTVLHDKQGMFSDSPELWAELKQKADGVVFGVGG
jgi:hypothetical protein